MLHSLTGKKVAQLVGIVIAAKEEFLVVKPAAVELLNVGEMHDGVVERGGKSKGIGLCHLTLCLSYRSQEEEA